MFKRDSLDTYDDFPEGMIRYFKYYGRHFNQKLCDFAVSRMTKTDTKGDLLKITPITKEWIDNMLKIKKITLKNNELYDYVYVANMCKADFYGSSIKDDDHLILYIKDVIDDPDGYDGLVFNRWYADTVRCGIPIEWNDMI